MGMVGFNCRKRALKRSRSRKLVLSGETEVPGLFFSLRLKDLFLPSRVGASAVIGLSGRAGHKMTLCYFRDKKIPFWTFMPNRVSDIITLQPFRHCTTHESLIHHDDVEFSFDNVTFRYELAKKIKLSDDPQVRPFTYRRNREASKYCQQVTITGHAGV